VFAIPGWAERGGVPAHYEHRRPLEVMMQGCRGTIDERSSETLTYKLMGRLASSGVVDHDSGWFVVV